MAAGFGRGGRAEALLKALNQTVRKPGSRLEEENPPHQQQQAVGRSVLLQQYLSQMSTPASHNEVKHSEDSSQPPLTLARGRSALLQSALYGEKAMNETPATFLGHSTRKIPAFPASSSSYDSSSSCSSPCSQSVPVVPSSSSHSSPAHSRCPSSSSGTDKERLSKLQLMLQRLDLNASPVVRKGTKGEKIPVLANYIPVYCENKAVYLYDVKFSPCVDSRSLRSKLLGQHHDIIGNVRAFDGNNLFLPKRLPQNKTILKSVYPLDGKELTICITLVKTLPPASCVQLYNIIFRKIMSILKMSQVGQRYYHPDQAVLIPQHKLEIWPGYITSVDEYEGGLMMLVDVNHKVLHTETVLDVMADVIQLKPQNLRKALCEKIIGQVVLTRYNNRTYFIDDIIWDKNPLSTFKLSSGEETTFAEYYKKHYNQEISDVDQPLLLNISKSHTRGKNHQNPSCSVDICLIPELCYITGLTDTIRKDFRVMKDLALHSRLSPDQRQLSLRKFCESVNSVPEARAELQKWGLQLDMDVISLMGRKLQEEKIIFKNHRFPACPQANWSRLISREHVLSSVDLMNWMVLFAKRDAQVTQNFIHSIQQVSPAMGWQVGRPVMIELPNDRTESYISAIRENLTPQTQMVVAIFPTARGDTYNAFKKLCCVEAPVPSQVINSRTISRKDKLRSIVQKITLQMNCKLGGELWHVNVPTSSLMVCGIDTYHSPGHKNSIGGFVASLNSQCTKWFSLVCHQMPGQELIDGLKVCLLRCLRKWHEVNHTLPERIIVFRDGVGNKQLRVVEKYEVQQLCSCFSSVSESYQPKFGMIVVQKHINTRLFAMKGHESEGGIENTAPGTVMDHTVTSRDWYDFFLVSQHVNQGTVTPTHYIVVHDRTGWCPDFIQQLSYKMTHMYYNWPGTIRVPAPCQYAHKLAYQVGENLHKDPNIKLCDRLFYL